MNKNFTRIFLIIFLTGFILSKSNSQETYLSFFSSPDYRLVQGISISQDGKSIYCTLPHREYQKAKNKKIEKELPRLAIYELRWKNKKWSAPRFLNLTDTINHYEPTLQPGTDILVFNTSKEGEKNDLWFTEKKSDYWMIPRPLNKINTTDGEESYATISSDSKMIYMKEVQSGGVTTYALYETTFRGDDTGAGNQLPFQGSFGDPAISPDGNILIFTGFDAEDWNKTCDLYISARSGKRWSKPQALIDLNSPGPDFSPYISSDGQWFYYRKNFQFQRVPIRVLIPD